MTEETKLQEIREIIEQYAEAKAQKDYLEEFKKSKLSILMKEYEVKGISANNAQEREARADERYIEILKGLRDATKTAESLRWQLKIKEMQFEVWREKQWNQRAEQKRYGA